MWHPHQGTANPSHVSMQIPYNPLCHLSLHPCNLPTQQSGYSLDSQSIHPVEIQPEQVEHVHHGGMRSANDYLVGTGKPPHLVRNQKLPYHKAGAVGTTEIDIPLLLTGQLINRSGISPTYRIHSAKFLYRPPVNTAGTPSG